MIRAEFHCHTIYSKDSLLKINSLIKSIKRKKLDRVAITDHNTIGGALRAKELAPEHVIVGEEIMTTKGELLAYFMTEEIKPYLSPQETINQLREQEAFISVAHPFDRVRKGHWDSGDLLDILPLVDAIEVFNARCIFPQFNTRANEFALQNNILSMVGSDAHTSMEIGRATTLLPDFSDTTSLKIALINAQFDYQISPVWIHFTSRIAKWYKTLFTNSEIKQPEKNHLP